MININFKTEKPKYFGYSGVHLYEVKPIINGDEKNVVVSENAKAATLYKLYNDLAIFLSNETCPNPKVKNVKTYLIFGNPENNKLLSKSKNPNQEFQIVGYLNYEDIELLSTFINSNNFDNMEGVEKYYEKLNNEVKAELKMLLEDSLITELNKYLQLAIELIKKCIEDESEIVIITNG